MNEKYRINGNPNSVTLNHIKSLYTVKPLNGQGIYLLLTCKATGVKTVARIEYAKGVKS